MRQREDGEIDAREINLDDLCQTTPVSEGSATVAEKRHWQVEGGGDKPSSSKPASSAAVAADDVPINEDLFNEEDLEGLEDELEDLDVDDDDEDDDDD